MQKNIIVSSIKKIIKLTFDKNIERYIKKKKDVNPVSLRLLAFSNAINRNK